MSTSQPGSINLDRYPLPTDYPALPARLQRSNQIKRETPRLSTLLRPLVLPPSRPVTVRSNRVQKRSAPSMPPAHESTYDLEPARKQQLLDAAILNGHRNSEGRSAPQPNARGPNPTACSVAYAQYRSEQLARSSSGLSMSSDGWSFTLEAPKGSRGYWTTRMFGPLNVQVVFEAAMVGGNENVADPYSTVDVKDDVRVHDQYANVDRYEDSDEISSDGV